MRKRDAVRGILDAHRWRCVGLRRDRYRNRVTLRRTSRITYSGRNGVVSRTERRRHKRSTGTEGPVNTRRPRNGISDRAVFGVTGSRAELDERALSNDQAIRWHRDAHDR